MREFNILINTSHLYKTHYVTNRSQSGYSDNPWKHADALFNVTLFKKKVLDLLLKTSYWKQLNPV